MELAEKVEPSMEVIFMSDKSYHFDVIVVGGGHAALVAAISARDSGASVALVTKGKAGLGGSSVISDGVYAAIFSLRFDNRLSRFQTLSTHQINTKTV